MKDFIEKFLEMEGAVSSIRSKNPNLVMASANEKVGIRAAFVKAVAKLIAVLNAAGYKLKGKPLPEMEYTVYNLNKLSAEKLCQAYSKVFAAVKKIKNREYFGLSNVDMHDMEAYYKEFNAIKRAPAVKKKEKALDNRKLENAVKECISFLEKHIDRMMLLAAEDDANLQYEYKALRKVLPRSPGRPTDQEMAYRKSREKKQ